MQLRCRNGPVAGPFFVLMGHVFRRPLQHARRRIALESAWVMVCLIAICGCVSPTAPRSDDRIWSRLKAGGYVIVIAHEDSGHDTEVAHAAALSPARCEPMSSLSQTGFDRAMRLGEQLRRHGVIIERVLTSRDCRCIATAGAAFDQAQPWSIIDDLRGVPAPLREQRRIALREAVSRWSGPDNLALVSHAENIDQAFGAAPRPGQLLVVEPRGAQGSRVLGIVEAN